MIEVLKSGVQMTLQGDVRSGLRHFGVPGAGPADPLSMSLANRLVGASCVQTAVEMTLTGGAFRFDVACDIALTGAPSDILMNGSVVPMHKTIRVDAGDEIEILPAQSGCRVYMAVSAKIEATEFIGSASTYLPGQFGGMAGRALQSGDRIGLNEITPGDILETPIALRPLFNDNFVLQVCPSIDYDTLAEEARHQLLELGLRATSRASRMGVELAGENPVQCDISENRPSSPVFPGSLQCPPDGKPFILLADAQTTGGYPHVLQVIRSDRFQLGQIKPGASVRFVLRRPDEAMERLRARWNAYSNWLSSPVI